MATISITQAFKGQPEAAIQVLRQYASPAMEEHGIQWVWSEQHAKICGKGVKGECVVENGVISVELRLGLLLSAFKGRIEQEIVKALAQVPEHLLITGE